MNSVGIELWKGNTFTKNRKFIFFNKKNVNFAAGKSYTTSSCLTPPGSEGSKGTMVERCDVSSLPFFIR